MIRSIDVNLVSEQIKEMCIEANYYLSKDMNGPILEKRY